MGWNNGSQIRAVKQADDRAQIALREVEGNSLEEKESHKTECEVLGGLFTWTSILHCKNQYREDA